MDEGKAMKEMPRYKCHKIVWALKIADIGLKTKTGEGLITPAEETYAPFTISAEYMAKHDPKVGGYFVQYHDGYTSFSPAMAFEAGYTRL